MKKEVWTGFLVFLIFLVSTFAEDIVEAPVETTKTTYYYSYDYAIASSYLSKISAAADVENPKYAFFQGLESRINKDTGTIIVSEIEKKYMDEEKFSPDDTYRIVETYKGDDLTGTKVEEYSWVDDYLLFGDGWVDSKVDAQSLKSGPQQVSFFPGSSDRDGTYQDPDYGGYCPV